MGGSKKRKAAKKKKAIEEPSNLVIVQQQQNNAVVENEERDSDARKKEVVSPAATDAELRRDDELPPIDNSKASETTTTINAVDIEDIVVECSEDVERNGYNDCQCVVLDTTAEMNDGVDYSLVIVDTADCAAVSDTEYVVEDTNTMLHTSSKLEEAASIAPPAIDLVEDTPETFHKQPLVGVPVPPRLVMDEKSSWLGCCGMFDLIRGSR